MMMPRIKRMYRLLSRTAFMLGLTTLAGCGPLFGCLLDPQMNLKTESLPEGQVGEEYHVELTANIENSWWDSRFDFDYELEAGALPAGLILLPDGDRAIITGVPEEEGTFPLTIEVYSYDLAAHSSYDNCVDSSDEKAFSLEILAGEMEDEPEGDEIPLEEEGVEEPPAE